MDLCARHEDLLVMALELRGLLRPSLTEDADLTPLVEARQALVTHATNFAGRAAVDMLTARACPLCFINRNPAGINLDGWIDNAADEALAADAHRADGESPSVIVQ